MFPAGPPAWGAFLPARGASQVIIDGALTNRFDQIGYLLLGLSWLAVITASTILVFRRRLGLTRSSPHGSSEATMSTASESSHA